MKFTHLVLIGLIFWAFEACKSETKEEAKQDKFCLTDTLYKNLETVVVEEQAIKNQLQLSGKITPHEDLLVKISPLVNGVIEHIAVELGDYVQKGQTLAVIRSTEIADVENQIMLAKSNLLVAKKNLSVAQELFKSGLAPEHDVVIAQEEVQKAESEAKKSQDVSNVYGIKNSTYSLQAPISGYVVDKNIALAEKMQYRLEDTGTFFTVANLAEVQVVANVFESDITKIDLGQPATIRLIAYPDEKFVGKIDKIYRVLDPVTRSMKVRINIPNASGRLKPEMFAEVRLDYANKKDEKMIAIPSKAVIFDKNKNFVMIYHERCNLETREIKIDHNSGDLTYVRAGLKIGEKVMSKYQLLVYDALND